MKLNLLLTGNELMTGDIVDSNSAMIARYLAPQGWSIHKKLTVGDDLQQLIDALHWLARDCDVLLVNGGLGPTVDDLTAQALADACRVPLAEQPAALEHLTEWCARIGVALNAANRKQTILPLGCALVANPIGSAVGFSMRLGDCLVICTPGVPRELDAMLTQEIIPTAARAIRQPVKCMCSVSRCSASANPRCNSKSAMRFPTGPPTWNWDFARLFAARFKTHHNQPQRARKMRGSDYTLATRHQ